MNREGCISDKRWGNYDPSYGFLLDAKGEEKTQRMQRKGSFINSRLQAGEGYDIKAGL
jgi:hypothetical protein